MSKKEKKEPNTQDKDMEKLIKGYVDTVFNVWRMGKDIKSNYEDTKKRLEDVNEILNDHTTFLNDVEKLFSNIGYTFDAGINLEKYEQDVKNRQKTLEKSLKPLKNLSKKYDRILKILKKNGFQIVEFDGKKFDDGMSIKVLGYDSKQDIEEDTIIETVKPTIFFNDKEYLKGEVIVSTKADNE